ncbi:DUF5361 domain-containing protein [Alloscardovia omnicolens]
MLAAHPDVLRADFQRFYGLNLDDLGTTLRVRRAADLAAYLPEQALIWGKLNPTAQWSTDTYLLAEIADNTDFEKWRHTKEAQVANAKWRSHIQRPGQETGVEHTGSMDAQLLVQILYGGE